MHCPSPPEAARISVERARPHAIPRTGQLPGGSSPGCGTLALA